MAAAIRAGCAGFPIGRARYFAALGAVELDAFERTPKLATLEKIKAEAPAGFEFSLRAARVITHAEESAQVARRQVVGHFRDTPQVGLAWEGARAAAEAVGAKFVVFETPSSFYPDADHLRDMYRFFKGLRRPKGAMLIWQPKGSVWQKKLVDKCCADLGLVLARDPLETAPDDSPLKARPAVQYFRLRGGVNGTYTEGELEKVKRACSDIPSFVIFTNRLKSFRDARRLIAGASLRR